MVFICHTQRTMKTVSGLNVGIPCIHVDFSITNTTTTMTFIPSTLLLLNSHSLDIRIRNKQQRRIKNGNTKKSQPFSDQISIHYYF